MSNLIVNTIIQNMASHEAMAQIQKVQTEHRLKLADFWNIHEGAKVLEVGCGQGDTTAVLAYKVGKNGFVHGIDIGSPAYGAPISLGESAAFLMKSALGKQIKMEFEIDVLSPEVDFPEESFDYIVLSHCSWYFSSPEELKKLLAKVRRWGSKLCFAEWDTRISMIEQYPHLLAVLIQAQYESFKKNSDANVRTLLTPLDLKQLAEGAGWSVINEGTIFSPNLQDGDWEVEIVLSDFEAELENVLHMPAKLSSLIHSEVLMLKEAVKNHGIKPLSTYIFIAE